MRTFLRNLSKRALFIGPVTATLASSAVPGAEGVAPASPVPAVCQIDIYDKIAIDHSLLVFHMHNQAVQGLPIDLQQPVLRGGKVWKMLGLKRQLHTAVRPTLTEGWQFHPFYGVTGSKDWGRGYLTQRTLMGFLGIHEEKKLITLIFRGSQCWHDWLNNFNLGLRKLPGLPEAGYLHAGYVNAFLGCKEGLEEVLDQLLIEGKELDKYQFIIAGHSFGGSVATIAAAWLRTHSTYSSILHTHNTRLITFGAPAAGMQREGESFRLWLDQHLSLKKRFVRETDTFVNYSTHPARWSWEKEEWYPCYISVLPIPEADLSPLAGAGEPWWDWLLAHHPEKYRHAIYEAGGWLDEYVPLILGI